MSVQQTGTSRERQDGGENRRKREKTRMPEIRTERLSLPQEDAFKIFPTKVDRNQCHKNEGRKKKTENDGAASARSVSGKQKVKAL